MTTNRSLQRAIRLALSAGAGSLAALNAPVSLAQDETPNELEEITVTGSRIPRADLASSSPVSVLERDDIVITGLTDVGNLIQRMPSMSGSPIGTTTNNGGNGSVLIDLRGMGVDRTVTLINGYRTVDGGDYQTIPTQMIERVEILKDGASAVYGADAVAGVVNIITRKDFDGISVDLQTADFFDMDDGEQLSAGVIVGKQFDQGNFVFGAEYVNQSQAYQQDAPWDYFQDTYYIYPEGCENQVAAPYDGTPSGGCYPLGSSRIPEGRMLFATQGFFMAPTPGAPMEPWDGRTYNFAPINYIQTPYERTNIFAEGAFDVSENVRASASLRGNFRESAQELAPTPYTTESDPAFPVTFGGVSFEGISEENFYLRQAIDAYNAANGTALIYEPVINARRRMTEIPRRFTQDITQYQFVGSLAGEFSEMGWEIFYNRGHRSRVDHDTGQFSGPRLATALGPSADVDGDGQPECYGSLADATDIANALPGCVPLNLFAGPGAIPADQLAYVAVASLTDTFVTTQEQAGFSVNGELFELPGGPLGWAVGYAYFANSLDFVPDSGKQLDIVTGNTGAGTAGSLYNNGVFLELLAPMYRNGEQSLNVKLGARYDDYNAFDGEATWQLGLEFQAVESLKLRGTAGTVFRAPTISDLFGGIVDSFPTYNDPCIPAAGDPLPAGCAQVGVQFDSQLLAKVGGNPDLHPETGESYTAGVVWTPQFQDLTVTLDYWQVDLEEGISSLGVQFILDDCYTRQNPASCALVTRNADYSIKQVVDTSLNVAEQGAKGVDTEIRWNLESGFGQWEAALLWSHLLERTKVPFPGAREDDLSGRFTDPTAEDGGAYATNKINYSLQWYRENWTIGYLGEYVSGLDADTFCNCGPGNAVDPETGDPIYIQTIDAQLYHDIVASYEFENTGTRIAAGVTNITDEEPPYMDIGFNANTDPSTYRLFGRGYYVRLTQSFE
ncbi:MAG: TonB-dependent receptor plug domain-containing protein [Kiloniellales bacterium]